MGWTREWMGLAALLLGAPALAEEPASAPAARVNQDCLNAAKPKCLPTAGGAPVRIRKMVVVVVEDDGTETAAPAGDIKMADGSVLKLGEKGRLLSTVPAPPPK